MRTHIRLTLGRIAGRQIRWDLWQDELQNYKTAIQCNDEQATCEGLVKVIRSLCLWVDALGRAESSGVKVHCTVQQLNGSQSAFGKKKIVFLHQQSNHKYDISIRIFVNPIWVFVPKNVIIRSIFMVIMKAKEDDWNTGAGPSGLWQEIILCVFMWSQFTDKI